MINYIEGTKFLEDLCLNLATIVSDDDFNEPKILENTRGRRRVFNAVHIRPNGERVHECQVHLLVIQSSKI